MPAAGATAPLAYVLDATGIELSMLAALDETYPELAAGIAYVVAATVLVADENETRAMVAEVLDAHGRTRPFHWHSEGPLARNRMLQCLEDLGAIAHVCVHYPTSRKRIDAARALCLRAVIPKLIADGASQLLIESRGTLEDARDRGTILDTFNDIGASGAFAYGWRGKHESVTWLADAVCGAVREHLIDPTRARSFDRLREAAVLSDLTYVAGG